MLRVLCMAAFAACFVAFAAIAQTPAVKSEITDLGYSVRSADSVYISAQLQGKPVHLMRDGMMGSGKWTIYTGTLANRVRLTIDDRKGLQEFLAMDTGQRMRVNRIGEERIEYRLYAPDRKFLIGSVLYRNKGRWLQGIMRTEAFAGYNALVDVTDMTQKVKVQAAAKAATFAGWLANHWDALDLIPAARAQNDPASVKRLLTLTNDFLNGPVAHEMMGGMLIGGAAFTAKLVEVSGGMPALLQLVGGGAAATAMLPMLELALTALVVAAVANKTYEMGDKLYERVLKGKNLGSSVGGFLSSLFRCPNCDDEPKQYAEQATPPTKDLASLGRSESSPNLLDMVDRLDKLDKQDNQDLLIALDLANRCTQRHDFACSAEQIADASKLANGSSDKELVVAARQNMESEKARMAQDARRRAEEEQRRLAQAERVAQAEQAARAAQRRQEEAEASQSGSFNWGKAAALLGGSTIGGLGRLAPEAQSRIITGILKDSMAGQEGIDNFKSATDSRQSTNAQRQSGSAQQVVAGSSPGAGRGSTSLVPAVASWHEDYTITENQSGRVSRHSNYSTNIPGDVITGQMGSQGAAQSFYGSQQGANVTSYSGCGACGVGSTVTVVVRYASVTDTHVYTRDR